MGRRQPVIDLTMGLLNRTAVYDIGLELAALRPDWRVRYWRWIGRRPIRFARTPRLSLAGKAIGRLAIRDVASRIGPAWPRRRGPMLFVDPIFAAKTQVRPHDIVIGHDVAPVSHPEYYDPGAGDVYAAAYRRIQAARPAMVFVSDHTRRRFLDLYPADYRRTTVIPLYFRPALSGPEQAGPEQAEPGQARPRPPGGRGGKPYFLMVGGMERRKNFVAAIRAFLASGLAERGYRLLIAGPRGNLSAGILPALEGHPAVEHLGYVGTGALAALYAGAVALFFPSLVEGFGVPALEATRLGTIAIVSAGTVLEEVVGPDGLTVDPTSDASMIAGLRRAAALPAAARAAQVASVAAWQARFSIEAFRRDWTTMLEEAT